MKSENLTYLCGPLGGVMSDDARKLLKDIFSTSPHKVVKGTACWALAEMAKGASEDDQLPQDRRDRYAKDAITLLEMCTKDYADVPMAPGSKQLIGDAAKGILFAMRNLAIGKPIPDIAGKDIEGVAFKLSDYKGKVVVLDFWGYW